MKSHRILGWAAVVLWTGIGTVSAPAQQLDLENWVSVRSAGFTVRSNAAPERAAEIALQLEQFRAAFAQLAPELELRSPVPTRILAFENAASYEPFKTGTETRGTRILGQFISHRDGNYITLNADPRILGGFGVILHEYVHYLVTHNFPGVPRWFNEGLAEYYSTFEVEGQHAVIGRPVQRHLNWLRQRGRIDLAEVLETPRASKPQMAEKAGHFYAVSWGLVHYLFSSGEELADRLAAFLAESAEDPSTVFEEIFETRLGDLEQELRRYLLSESPKEARLPLEELRVSSELTVLRATGPEILVDLGGLAVRQGDENQAERLFDLALAYDPESPDAIAGLAHVRDLQSRLEEAEVLYRQGFELGASDPLTYIHYGRHLLTLMEEARRRLETTEVKRLAAAARNAFRGAVEIDPQFAEGHAMLGYAHLFGDLDPADGVAPLERARELLPARTDVVFYLLQLELRRGNFDRARSLADGPLRRLGDLSLQQRAEEEIERASYLRAANEAFQEGRQEEGLELMGDAIAITSDPDLRAAMELEQARLEKRFEDR
jgi:Tfp pilus assembly protein PilF